MLAKVRNNGACDNVGISYLALSSFVFRSVGFFLGWTMRVVLGVWPVRSITQNYEKNRFQEGFGMTSNIQRNLPRIGSIDILAFPGKNPQKIRKRNRKTRTSFNSNYGSVVSLQKTILQLINEPLITIFL